jgi:hypothetical protein
MKNLYFYDGPVMEFDKRINDRWQGSTYAVSENKARCNLAYQYKKSHNRVAGSKITLPGKLMLVEN